MNIINNEQNELFSQNIRLNISYQYIKHNLLTKIFTNVDNPYNFTKLFTISYL